MRGILHHDLVLDDVSQSTVDYDISVFFRDQFAEIRDTFEDPLANWPSDEKIGLLVKKSRGLFIYAATACRFVKDNSQWPPQDLLNLFIPSDIKSHPQNGERELPSKSPTWELDEMYIQILEHAFRGVEDAQDMKELSRKFKQVVGTLAILFEPLSAIALSKLLPVDEEVINRRLRVLRSVFSVPLHKGSLIRLLHPSFHDFLLDSQRCRNQYFCVEEKEAHGDLFRGSLRLMSNSLKRDICNLQAPGTLTTKLSNNQFEEFLPLELQYACCYWAQHLQKSGLHLHDDGPVHVFLKNHLLHWIEALGLIKKTSEGILAIALLKSSVNAVESPYLYAFLSDARRFIIENQHIIVNAALQIYYSALAFTPESSVVRRQFQNQMPDLPTLNSHISSISSYGNIEQQVWFEPMLGSQDTSLVFTATGFGSMRRGIIEFELSSSSWQLDFDFGEYDFELSSSFDPPRI